MGDASCLLVSCAVSWTGGDDLVATAGGVSRRWRVGHVACSSRARRGSGSGAPDARPIPWRSSDGRRGAAVSYTHLRAHETRHDLVCRLLLEKKKKKTT